MQIYQMEFNGLEIGPGTDYPLTLVEGMGGFDTRVESSPRTIAHGSLAIARFLNEKPIIMQGYVNKGSAAGDKLDALKTAFAPREDPAPMRVWMDWGVRQINVQPTRLIFPYESGYKKGQVFFTLEVLAADPKFYDDAQSFLSLGAVANIGQAENGGNIPTQPLLIVEGGTTGNPYRLVNQNTGKELRINRGLANGEQMVIDFGEKTVKVGVNSVYSLLAPTSEWWEIEPGVNDIQAIYTGTAQTKLYWRSAWI
jgi:hypothetical protein